MTQDEIIRLAQDVGFSVIEASALEYFYQAAFAAGAAHEREACAKVCDDGCRAQINDHYTKGLSHGARLCATAIRERSANARARGEK